MKTILILTVFFITNIFAESNLHTYLKDGISATVLSNNDFKLKFETGSIKSLYIYNKPKWMKKGSKIIFVYSNEGIQIQNHNKTKTISIDNNDIYMLLDVALAKCETERNSQLGYYLCAVDAEHSWDLELNKAYKMLGGSSNKKLKVAQLKWIEFRDLQKNYYKSLYDGLQGSKWNLIYQNAVNNLTETQAKTLGNLLYASPAEQSMQREE